MKTFFHGTDMDGKCSGAIVRKYYGDEMEYIPYNYEEFPFDSIEKDELVILVDCSCDFNKLLEITKNIIWIDHHITAINQYEHLNILGLRRDGTAACELCWEVFYSEIDMPLVVKLLGDYDVWKFAYGEDTNKLQTGIRLYDTSVDSKEWDRWLNPKLYPLAEINKGEIALRYRDNYYEGLIKAFSFFAEFEGYKAVCCNAGSVSSQLFDSVKEDYDIMMPFVFNGKEWVVSLYTKKDINVGEIAKKYGGGGHAKAAGFRCSELPLRVL